MSDTIEILMDSGDLAVLGPPDVVTVVYDVGATGARGSLWFSGEGLPSELTIPNYERLQTNDMYLDSITGWTYQYILLPSNTNDWVAVHATDVVAASHTPTGSADTQGVVGDIAADDSYVYVKTSTGWKRAALAAW